MHLNQPEKDFIRAGVLNLFQRVATEGKARADARPARGRGRQSADHPVYNINVSWSSQPPASSAHYICYFVRSHSQSIIRSLVREAVPEAQGLTTEITSQSISEVYVMNTRDVRTQLGNEQLVTVVFHEFLHNRLKVPTSLTDPHDVHEEDPTGYGAPTSSARFIRETDDPATIGQDERYRMEYEFDHEIELTESFDIDVVYASMGRPIPQYIHLRTPPALQVIPSSPGAPTSPAAPTL